ncbi:MAG TPA: hypothetical protein VFG54_12355 [Prolixibacteraceae bacterium]|nr:hypothetical protein [Prolixibacteraceae bacterium]
MIVAETTPGKFDLKDLSPNELEILYEALESFEDWLPHGDDFQAVKGKCTEMSSKIDAELIKLRS